jgi:hypothetical protein
MPTPRARSPFDRLRWTAEDAREVIAALDRSVKPVSVFDDGVLFGEMLETARAAE